MPRIKTNRLDLIPMSTAFLQACLAAERERASQLLRFEVPEVWLQETELMALRLEQLRAESGLEPWLLRAMCLRNMGTMVGHIGFHGKPGAAYLADLAPGGVEMGYTVFAPYRHQGYAREALGALMMWAEEKGVSSFVLSIRPDNLPSLRLAKHYGFRKVSSHVDPEDGLEDVYILNSGYRLRDESSTTH